MRQQGNLQIMGYTFHEAEFNIASMFKRTIQRAFFENPKSKMEVIAEILGVSTRTLHRVCDEWEIERPKKEVQKRKSKRDLAKFGVLT